LKANIKILAVLLIMLFLATCGLANTHSVNFYIIPVAIENIIEIKLPLFIIMFISIFIGLIFGCMIEFNRGGYYRRLVKTDKKIIKDLSNKLYVLKKQTKSEEDDILALLD
jgi:uncharacterized integral membrane protein